MAAAPDLPAAPPPALLAAMALRVGDQRRAVVEALHEARMALSQSSEPSVRRHILCVIGVLERVDHSSIEACLPPPLSDYAI